MTSSHFQTVFTPVRFETPTPFLTDDEAAVLKACAKSQRGVPLCDAEFEVGRDHERAVAAIDSLIVMGFVETPLVQLTVTPQKLFITRRGIKYAFARGWAVWGNLGAAIAS